MSRRPPAVLVVDDDAGIRTSLQRALTLEGFDVELAADGEGALAAVSARPPSVVVLDLGLPGLDGLRVLRRLRDGGVDTPVCILSARDDVDDRVAGLQAGADDYLVKPFAVPELAARLHALLRRSGDGGIETVVVGDVVVDGRRRLATRGGRDLALTRREFDLLRAFVSHPGQVLSREQLLELVWGYTFEVDSNTVDVFVGYVRRKLEAGGEPRILHTERGVGWTIRA